MRKVETHNALKYIKDGLEYLLLIGVIIECNSLYRHYSGLSLQAGLFLEGSILTILVLLLGVRCALNSCRTYGIVKTIVVLALVEVMSVVFVFVNGMQQNENGLLPYYSKIFLLFFPMMILLFRWDIMEGK